MIKEFKGQYGWLSSMYEVPVFGPAGIVYPAVENAYQAYKLGDPDHGWPTRMEELLAFTKVGPHRAKMLGRKIELREDWHKVRVHHMIFLVRQKFRGPRTEHKVLGEKLAATDGEHLQEGNWWHDNFWGICQCWKCHDQVGENMLGKILMKVREEILCNSNSVSSK